MGFLLNPIMIPLGGLVMVVLVVGMATLRKMREKELQAHQELRSREMEHERKMKEMDIEKAKLEVEKVRVGKST